MNAITKDVAVAAQTEINRYRPEFAKALPAHIPVEKFVRVAQTAVLNNPTLLTADRRQVMVELVKCASDGLIPDGREAAVVPTSRGPSYRPMVAGLLKLARNSGEIASIHAEVVYRGEKFQPILGDDPRIEHERDLERADTGEWIAVYAVATLKNGEKSRRVMSRAQVLRIRDRSDAWRAYKAGRIKDTPWNTDEEAMALKTVVRQLAKWLPRSTDKETPFERALERDDDVIEATAQDVPPALAITAALAASDDDDNPASSHEPANRDDDGRAHTAEDAAAGQPPPAEPAAGVAQPALLIGPAMFEDGIAGKARQRILDLWNDLSACLTPDDAVAFCGGKDWLAAIKWLDENGHARTRAALIARGNEIMRGTA